MIKRSDLKMYLTEGIVSESINKSYSAPENKPYDIFLCHASDDKNEIYAIKRKYEKLGKKVYVAEYEDPVHSIDDVDRKFAMLLQKRLQNSANLYYVLSVNSQKSTWTPWELGYFSRVKPTNVFILPIIDREEKEILKFEGHEYLELYPMLNEPENKYAQMKALYK